MKIYAARHGRTVWNEENRICGLTDIPLSSEGKIQAEMMAEDERLGDINVIISSPLLRAVQTAEPLSEKLGVGITTDPRLTEQNYGIYEGMDRNTKEYLENKGNFAFRYPGGESMLRLCHRVYGFLEDVKKKYRGKTVLLITHGGVLRMINTYFEDMTNRQFVTYSLKNCEIKEYDL